MRQSLSLPQRTNLIDIRRPTARHQTSAALARFDESYDDDPEPTETSQPYNDVPQDAAGRTVRSQRRRKRRMTGRLTLTKDLDVDRLGKPANIILLKDRDRHIPEHIEEDERQALSLSEQLEEENNPTPWAQVVEHLEQIRAKGGDESGRKEARIKTQLITELRQTFTAGQLVKYAFEHHSEKWAPSIQKLERTSKFTLAVQVVNRIWGFGDPAKDFEKQLQSGLLPGQTRKEFRVPARLGWQSLRDTPRIQNIAKETGTTITFSQLHRHTFKITGHPENVDAAEKRLRNARVVTTIDISGFKRRFAVDGKEAAFAKLRKKIDADFHVNVDSNLQKHAILRVSHWQEDWSVPEEIRRRLWHMADTQLSSECHSIIMATSKDGLKLAPYHPVTPSLWYSQPNDWARIFDTAIGATTSSHSSSNQLAKFNWDGINQRLIHPQLKNQVGGSNSLRCELSANAGIDLHHTKNMNWAARSSRSWFVNEVPLVAQLLASTSAADVQESEQDPEASTNPGLSPLVVRLLLKQVDLAATGLSIEIYLRGADASAGLLQKLNVSRITAVLHEKRINLSSPSSQVDFSVMRRIKQDLFIQSSPTTSVHPSLLKQLETYLAQARKEPHEAPRFPLFADFHIPPELLMFAPGKASLELKEGSDATDPETKNSGKLRYVLAAVEALDYQHRSIKESTATAAPKSKKRVKKGKGSEVAPPILPPRPILQYTTYRAYLSDTRVDSTTHETSSGHDMEAEQTGSTTGTALPPSPTSHDQQFTARHELQIVEAPQKDQYSLQGLSIVDLRHAMIYVAQQLRKLGQNLRL